MRVERRVAEESARLLKAEAKKAAAAQKAEDEKETARRAKAEAPKKPRGGRRPNAGRKPDYLRRSGLPPLSAHLILSHYDVVKLWGSLLTCRSDDVRLKALAYLTDRVLGKVPEHVVSSSASSIEVSFRSVSTDDEVGKDELLLRLRKSPPELQAVAPEPILEAVPEPVPQRQPRPPLAIVSGLECPRHGEYVVAGNSQSTACPSCVREAAEDQRRLFSLMPNRPN